MNVWQFKFRHAISCQSTMNHSELSCWQQGSYWVAVQKNLFSIKLWSPSGYCGPWGGWRESSVDLLLEEDIGKTDELSTFPPHPKGNANWSTRLFIQFCRNMISRKGGKLTRHDSLCSSALEAAAFDMHFDFRGRKGESDPKSLMRGFPIPWSRCVCKWDSSDLFCLFEPSYPPTSLHSADRHDMINVSDLLESWK